MLVSTEFVASTRTSWGSIRVGSALLSRHSHDSDHRTGKVPVTDTDRKEIERLLKIFDNARTVTKQAIADRADVKDEGFLFGDFGIADAFFWPVLWVSLPLIFPS